MLRSLFVVTFLLASSQCHASNTGIEVMKHCGVAMKIFNGNKQVTAEENANAMYCIGLVEGVRDSVTIWEDSARTHKTNRADVPCVPENVSTEQAIRITYKYMQDHPASLNLPGTGLVYLALLSAYPCGV